MDKVLRYFALHAACLGSRPEPSLEFFLETSITGFSIGGNILAAILTLLYFKTCFGAVTEV